LQRNSQGKETSPSPFNIPEIVGKKCIPDDLQKLYNAQLERRQGIVVVMHDDERWRKECWSVA